LAAVLMLPCSECVSVTRWMVEQRRSLCDCSEPSDCSEPITTNPPNRKQKY